MTALSTLWYALIASTLFGVAVGRYPALRMNRATIAMVGATALVALGAIPLERAAAAVDLHTLALLLGMMVLNANLRLAGFFELVAGRLATRAHSPRGLLALVVFAAGALSALFLNDTIVLVFTPLALELTLAARLPPVPFLMAVATAANVGSVATLIGNPQNMLVGMASGIGFVPFAAAQAPVAAVGLGLTWAVLAWVYRRELGPPRTVDPAPAAVTGPGRRVLRPLLWKSVAATALLLIALLAEAPPPLAALGAASVLLVSRRLKPERVFREIDWSLLVFFAGLFVVTAAVETSGAGERLFSALGSWAAAGPLGLAALSAVLSNLVSNVPAVLLLRPVVEGLADPRGAWLTVAMATTLAGNLTLLGSVANLIVAETAKRQGVTLSFAEYLKAGVPVTLATLAWGVVWRIWELGCRP